MDVLMRRIVYKCGLIRQVSLLWVYMGEKEVWSWVYSNIFFSLPSQAHEKLK